MPSEIGLPPHTDQRSSADDAGLWRASVLGIPQVTSEQWAASSVALRWLIATRASVLPLTGFSVLFAIALAQPQDLLSWSLALCTLVALLLAHATNNLLNDYVDFYTGVDDDNYVRAQYGVHVLAAGLLARKSFLRYLWVTGSSALLAGVGVCLFRGGWIYAFAGAGALFVLFYTYPLKRWALGEVAVLLTWGPLMIGGTYLAVTGSVAAVVLWAGLIYGLGPTVVIFAKHTDKAAHDIERGLHTLPTLLQELLSAAVARNTITLLALLQVLGALWIAIWFGFYGMLGVCLGLPALRQLMKVNAAPPPATCPQDYPLQAWPLWYTTYGFIYARNAGAGLTAGVLLQALL